jgi:hypothetical protein
MIPRRGVMGKRIYIRDCTGIPHGRKGGVGIRYRKRINVLRDERQKSVEDRATRQGRHKAIMPASRPGDCMDVSSRNQLRDTIKMIKKGPSTAR